MEGSIRVSAKTVDDAITEAMIRLSVTSDRLEYEIIEKGTPGLFGIGKKQAVIEARRKPEAETVTMEDIIEEVKHETDKKEKKEYKKEIKKDTKKEFKTEKKNDKKDFKKENKKENVKEAAPVRENSIASKKAAEERKADEAVKEENPAIKKHEEPAEVSEEAKKGVEKFLYDTLAAMGMDVKITSKIDEEGSLSIDLEGENMGILIGKRGQTLDSLQYLANRVANKYQTGYVRVKLDTENYRERREETLRHLAKNIAHKVKRTRRPFSLEPMNPYERRIIHSALQSDPYVTTHSEGEEPYRKVVITLKR